ncbi:small, acid-soluble spore protein K [Peribacillus sp. SCS-155]|uniref:small, acid-soluble spore protein K n=1 Tax=Peribacillus sedimenti TaxID=3115297 RepID=UPI003905E141
MRNKAHDFPYPENHRIQGMPRARAEYASKRADGSINTNPKGRMSESTKRQFEE